MTRHEACGLGLEWVPAEAGRNLLVQSRHKFPRRPVLSAHRCLSRRPKSAGQPAELTSRATPTEAPTGQPAPPACRGSVPARALKTNGIVTNSAKNVHPRPSPVVPPWQGVRSPRRRTRVCLPTSRVPAPGPDLPCSPTRVVRRPLHYFSYATHRRSRSIPPPTSTTSKPPDWMFVSCDTMLVL